jgi:predicted metal-dependent hydrolase
MQKEIRLQEQVIPYTFKVSPRARRLRLAVYVGGEFVVTAPKTMSEKTVENFILRKGDWVISTIDRLRAHIPLLANTHSKKEYRIYKEQARALVHERLKKFNTFYKLTYNQISIRNQKTRWGSCSKKGNLNFNYKIALLPEHLADYLVVHELCHVKEFNHSKQFWDLVAQTIPHHKQARTELKRC